MFHTLTGVMEETRHGLSFIQLVHSRLFQFLKDFEHYFLLGITHLFPNNELVHLPYIAVATNTSSREGEEPLRITESNTIVGLYPYSVFTNSMFLSTNSLSIVYTFS